MHEMTTDALNKLKQKENEHATEPTEGVRASAHKQ